MRFCIDWNNSDRSSKLIDRHFFSPFYTKLHSLSKEGRFMRLSAPFVGAVDGLAGLVQAFFGVGEALIKGARNLLQGAVYLDKDALTRGALQVVLGAGLVSLLAIPILIKRFLFITASMLKDPEKTTDSQANQYIAKVLEEKAINQPEHLVVLNKNSWSNF